MSGSVRFHQMRLNGLEGVSRSMRANQCLVRKMVYWPSGIAAAATGKQFDWPKQSEEQMKESEPV